VPRFSGTPFHQHLCGIHLNSILFIHFQKRVDRGKADPGFEKVS